MNHSSCVGCKFLCTKDYGYSNWTVEDTNVLCVLDKNPNLPKFMPWDWKTYRAEGAPEDDDWPKTNQSRCGAYIEGPNISMDVDWEGSPSDFEDKELLRLFLSHHEDELYGNWKKYWEAGHE